MEEPQVTLVVVPRERFSCTQESLESIYEHTEFPFKLVYVDGNSPAKVQRYLEPKRKPRTLKLFGLITTSPLITPGTSVWVTLIPSMSSSSITT
jgi:hypothetical protein